jgi:hypothetical protein
MRKFWQKIKFWFWWNFLATAFQKAKYDAITRGIGYIKSGKMYIKPDKFLLDEYKEYLPPNRTREKANDYADAIAYSFSTTRT